MPNLFSQFKSVLAKLSGSNPSDYTTAQKAAGFTLMETIVAITILLITVSGIMNLIYQGSVTSRAQTDRITATYLAADAIEYLQYHRDSHWLDFPADNTFDEWVNSDPITRCKGSPCRIDTRVGEGSINSCGGSCPALSHNDSSKLYGYGNGSASKFTRTVEITSHDNNGDGDDDEARITATVTWQRTGGQTSEVVLEESMFDYRDSNSLD